MRSLTRPTTLTCAIFALVFSSGCIPEIPRDPYELYYHMSAEPGTLNPMTGTDVYESRVNSFVYESLAERDNETLEWVPLLAESWKISRNKKVFTFKLRSGVRWHDGKPLTVEDVIYSYERIMDPKVDAPHLRVYYQDIEEVKVLDDTTIRFSMKKRYFRAFEFCAGMPVIPKHIFSQGDDFNNHPNGRAPIGTGPYRFERWETNKKIVLIRNESYWREKAEIRRIVFRLVQEDAVALQTLKKRELDLMGLVPIQWVKQTGSERFRRHFRKEQYYLPGYSYIGWNMKRPYFSDRRVRRALTMMIDREKILEKLLYGLGIIVTGNFYVNGPDYNRNIEPYPYDPERAGQLLREAGWSDHDGDGVLDKDGTKFSFVFLLSSGNRFREQIATILKEDFEKQGIQMKIERYEWAVFIKNLNERTFDAASLGWRFGVESDPYQVWHSSQAEKGSNFVGFKNEEADELIERAREEFDKNKRIDYFHRFHEILHEEQPYTFLFCSPSLVAINRRFENIRIYPLGPDITEWRLTADVDPET